MIVTLELEEIAKKRLTAIFLEFDVLSYEKMKIFFSYTLRLLQESQK